MKRIIIITIVAVLTAITGINACALNQNKKQNITKEEVTFTVALHCQNCVKKVEANIPFEKGVLDLKVLLDDHTVWIQYDPQKTDVEKLKAAIQKLGYEASEKK